MRRTITETTSEDPKEQNGEASRVLGNGHINGKGEGKLMKFFSNSINSMNSDKFQ